jgi:hypothetical protein
MPRHLILNRPLIELHMLLPTKDQWFPTIEDGYVMLSMKKDKPGVWRAAFWGDDDFGLERIFDNEEEMRNVVASVPIPVPIEWLRQNRFEDA